MSTLKLSAMALALGTVLTLNGCSTLGLSNSQGTTATAQQATTASPQRPARPAPKLYDQAPDLSQAEVLTAPQATAGAGISAATAAHANAQRYQQGGLISDANFNASAGSGAGLGAPQGQGTSIQSNAALAENLEVVGSSGNALLGAANPHAAIDGNTEVIADGNELVFEQPLVAPQGQGASAPQYNNPQGAYAMNTTMPPNQSMASMNAHNPAPYAQQTQTPPTSVSELSGYTQQQRSALGCSIALHTEASGVARTLIKSLAERLRNVSGSIFVAPTIVDREYQECVGDLSIAIQDGLTSVPAFQVVPATTNLNNIISQNVGSASMLPNIIHQCRASSIPYLVVSQIRKTGDKAALTLRIISTQDGITLNQTFRRLSQ